MHMIIPFPNSPLTPPDSSNTQPTSLYRLQITIDGEFPDDEMPPLLFDPDDDQSELDVYIQIAANSHNE